MSKKSFVKGAAILAVAGLLAKVLGAVFRIPLANIIGSRGMANYNIVYPIYAYLLVISTAGLPAAISRMVSERVTLGDYRGAHKVFSTALKMLLIIGVLSAILLFIFADVYAKTTKIPTAALGIRMISPALLFVAMLSAYRGYFQGLQQMMPTAATQIVEQVVKLGAGLLFAILWAPRGVVYGAAGALLGVSLSEVGALVLVIGYYNRKKKDIKLLRKNSYIYPSRSKNKRILKELVYIAFPITLGASIMPLIMAIDSFIINNILADMNFSAFNTLDYEQCYGVLTGITNPLINMPAVLSLALSMSLVPAISEARAKRDKLAISKRSSLGFKLSILVGLPSALGLFLLSDNIVQMLYSSGHTTAELAVGSQLLRILSIGVIFLTIIQTSTGIIQGAGKPYLPLINLAIGAVVKVILSIVLISQPKFNIYGAAIGTAVCYTIAAVLNIITMIKVTKPSIKGGTGIAMPILATAAMGAAVYVIKKFMINNLGNTITTLIAILGAVVVYGLMLLFTGALDEKDMTFIPGGVFITRVMRKLKLWRA